MREHAATGKLTKKTELEIFTPQFLHACQMAMLMKKETIGGFSFTEVAEEIAQVLFTAVPANIFNIVQEKMDTLGTQGM